MQKQLLNCLIFIAVWLLMSSAHASVSAEETAPKLLVKTDNGEIPALLMNSRLSGQVNGLTVSMTLKQEFKNNSDDWVNGRYVFPLPESATVDSLTLTNEDRILKGLVKEKQTAKRQFERAKAAGKKAGLLEQNRPNVFAMSMANIAPQSSVIAEITWVQTVHYEAGVFSLSLPTTLTPRYIPGKPLQVGLAEIAEKQGDAQQTSTLQNGWALNTDQVPDASEITPPQISNTEAMNSHQISLDLMLNAGLPLEKVASSSHAITVTQHDKSYHLAFKNKTALMDKDVLLQWQAAPSALPQAAVFSEQKDEAYYHMVMINPPVKSIVSTLPKDVTFIIDTSGSMAGGSMEQAKSGLLAALDLLSDKDRFNIIEFNTEAAQLYADSAPVNDISLKEAEQFVNQLKANGGTEMMNALQMAFGQASHEEYLRQIIFITDGAVGNEQALFSFINQNLSASRLFTVGIGSAPNSHFMQGAAKYGRGSATHINNLTQVNAKMTRLFEKLTYPVMRDVQANWPEGVTVESFPEKVPDLYVAEPIMLIARSEQPLSKLEVSGQIAGESWQQTLNTSQGAPANNLNKIWAKDKVNALIEKATLAAESVDLYKDEIVHIGITNQIATKFTSFVAIADEVSRPQGTPAKQTLVPNLLPDTKKLYAPRTATPATLQLLLGTLLLTLTLGYLMYTQRNQHKGGVA